MKGGRSQPFLLVLLWIMALGCTKSDFKVTEPSLGDGGGGDPSESDLGVLDTNCMSSSAYDGCLFSKNPVAQLAKALSEPLHKDFNLSTMQIYGVRLKNLDTSGGLSNASFVIVPATGSPVVVSSLSKYSFKDHPALLSQISAYFWMEASLRLMEKKMGSLYAKEKLIKVHTRETLAGWSSTRNEIDLATNDLGNDMALDGGIIAHFVGHANLSYATEKAIYDLSSDTNHVDCVDGVLPLKKGCCKDKNGCSKALALGVADYQMTMVFPNSPTLGETWVNKTKGVTTCGLSRHLDDLSSFTASQVYLACESEGKSGFAPMMGSLYASIWWEVQKMVTDPSPLYQLFSAHLAYFKGSDTFLDALDHITAADSALFGGQYAPFFVEEYTRRGL